MTDMELAAAITRRANELVQERLRVFHDDCERAIRALLPGYASGAVHARILLGEAARHDDTHKEFAGYPKNLWDAAEEEVRVSLFKAFDPLQRVLKAKDVDDPAGERAVE